MNIHTRRLIIREQNANDLDALYALWSNAVYQQYEGGPLSLEEVRLKLEKNLSWSSEQPRKRYIFAITLQPEDTARGIVKLTETLLDIREWEVGWGVHPAFWGKGYATEAAQEMLRLAFKTLNAHRVVAYCRSDNAASARVMEKLGMQRDGFLRETVWQFGQWWDEYIYSILDHEYLS
jgi:RimJ/RimL family protein N-acetyltransferase